MDGQLERLGVSSPVTFWVEKDSGSEDCVAYIIQSGLGLQDEAYYREEAHAETLAAYRVHVEEMLEFLDPARLFGLGAKVAAERIVNLEKKIAAGHWDVVATRDAVKTYNPTEFQDLPEIVRTVLTGTTPQSASVTFRLVSFCVLPAGAALLPRSCTESHGMETSSSSPAV